MTGDEPKCRGHWPSLLAAFLYFESSCMIWVLLGALGNGLSDAFGLTPAQKGLMVALPILGGMGIRPIAGLLGDRFGTRRFALGGMVLTAVPLLLGWLWVDTFAHLLVVGVLLGIAGASFAVALPMAGRWYPAEQQGWILGLVGAGNCGTALAALLAPQLVPLVGWHGVFGLALIPLVLVLAAFAVLAKDAPRPSPVPLREAIKVFGTSNLYPYCVFYAITFGGFVGVVSFLSIFFHDQYDVDPIAAGMMASICALVGSLMRPVGGLLADRFGGTSVLFLVFLGIGVVSLRLSYVPHLEVSVVALFLLLALMGAGNGAIFQLLGQRFRNDLGAVTGMIGAAGGLGGFLLPLLMGSSREWLGRFGPGFIVVALGGFFAAGLLLQTSRNWQSRGVPILGAGTRRREVEVVAQS